MLLHAIILASAVEDRSFRPRLEKTTIAVTQTYAVRSADSIVTKTFVVENEGPPSGGAADVVIREVAISGDALRTFHVLDDGCSDTDLATGESCTVRITFHARTAGEPRTATLIVSSYDEGRTSDGISVALSDGF